MGIEQQIEHGRNLKHAGDYAVGTAGAASPAWIPWMHQMNEIAALVATLGGAVLVFVRLAIAVRDWKQGRPADD